MDDDQQTSRVNCDQWLWSVITMPARNGWSETMAEALAGVRELASHDWSHTPHGWPDDQ